MGFSRQEYWSGLPCPPLGDLPDSGLLRIKLVNKHKILELGLVFNKQSINVPLHRSLPCRGKGACAIQWSYEPGGAGPPKTAGSQRRVLAKHGPLEEGMVTHSSILTVTTLWTIEKAKLMTPEDEPPPPPNRKVSRMLWGKSMGQLLRQWSGWDKAEMMLSGVVSGAVKNQQEFERTPGGSRKRRPRALPSVGCGRPGMTEPLNNNDKY